MTRIVVVGPIYCDTVFTGLTRLPLPGEEVRAEEVGWAPGGYAISALAFHRLEMPTDLLGEVGDDFYGEALRSAFQAEGLPANHVWRMAGAHTNIAVAMNWNGDRGIVSYGRAPVAELERYEEAVRGAGNDTVVYLSARHPHAQRLARLARSLGQEVALSLSWHPDFLTSWTLRDLLPEADMLFCNVPEALMVSQESQIEKAAELLHRSVPEVVITHGAHGAEVLSAAGREWAPAGPVVVVDATGAGDVFAATYVSARAWGWPVAERLKAAHWAAGHAIGSVGGGTAAPDKAAVLAAVWEAQDAGTV
jgi:sugar/nucleoside kinase (ribokinase family)